MAQNGTQTDHRVTCIIPAYNEGPRIAAVLRVATAHALIDRVLVVDDGSSDTTAEIAAEFDRVEVIRLPENGGKTRAVATGLSRSNSPFVLLLDSDLTGLVNGDLAALILPVLDGRADIAISLRGNTPGIWKVLGLDYISGERMLRRDLIAAQLGELAELPPFGLEVWMNRICVALGARIAIVPWRRVASTSKNRKFGVIGGLKADMRMMGDLFRCIPPLQLLRQIIGMLQLRVQIAPTGRRRRRPGRRIFERN
ncbi:hypothetical protein BV911_14000 [Pseudoruegeria sp. SK021]|nr:hypothetical protein BV911_14000 [Pseudoruegeria sp. SK021]